MVYRVDRIECVVIIIEIRDKNKYIVIMSLLSQILQNGSNNYRAQMPDTTVNVKAPQVDGNNVIQDIGKLAGVASSIASLVSLF